MKPPLNADLTYNWKFIKIYKWDQEMPDWSSNVFEIAQVRSTAWVIPVISWKIAIAYQTQVLKWSYYSLFWWMLEIWEYPLDWAKRELLEESWMESNDWELLVNINQWWMVDKTSSIFIARNCEIVSNPQLDKWELEIKPIYLDFEEFIDLVIFQQYNWKSVFFKGRNLQFHLMYLKVTNQLGNLKKMLFCC